MNNKCLQIIYTEINLRQDPEQFHILLSQTELHVVIITYINI